MIGNLKNCLVSLNNILHETLNNQNILHETLNSQFEIQKNEINIMVKINKNKFFVVFNDDMNSCSGVSFFYLILYENNISKHFNNSSDFRDKIFELKKINLSTNISDTLVDKELFSFLKKTCGISVAKVCGSRKKLTVDS